jgi:putative DNA primase/helicase
MTGPKIKQESEAQFPTSEKGNRREGRSGWVPPPVGQYLFVPYEDRTQAKELGAYWDAKKEAWYVPQGADAAPFARWESPPLPKSEAEIQSEFAAFCEDLGLVIDGLPEMDGRWKGTTVTTSKSVNAKKGRYILERDVDGGAHGHVINNDTGTSEPWFFKGVMTSEQDRAQAQRLLEENRRQRDQQQLEEHRVVSRVCTVRWNRMGAVDSQHGYLVKKGVDAIGLRQEGDKLVTAIRDDKGTIWSLQFVDPEGNKLYVGGGVKNGNCHVLGDLDAGKTVLFGEGYATCASLHMATGLPVVEVFDASNIEPVLTTLAKRIEGKDKIICGDDDVLTHDHVVRTINTQATSEFAAPKLKLPAVDPVEVIIDGQRRTLSANPQCSIQLEFQLNQHGVQRIVGDISNAETGAKIKVQIVNVGREKAIAAAIKHGAKTAFPVFASLESRPSDFNDLHKREGVAAVRRQVGKVMMMERPVYPAIEQTSTEVARATLGEQAVVRPAMGNQQYVGPVVGKTNAHAVQDVGRSTAVAHQLDKLDRVPQVGQSARIVYSEGKGSVQAIQQSRDGIVR